MSRNTKLKRIAAVAVAALGLGMLSVAPASAATTIASGAVLIDGSATATASVDAVGTVVNKTFALTTTASADTNTVVYSIAMTTAPAAAGSISPSNSSASTAATSGAKLRLNKVGLEAVTGWALTTAADSAPLAATMKDTYTIGGGNPELSSSDDRGTISFYPTHSGTYVITLTATPNSGSARTATLTVTVAGDAEDDPTAVNSISLAQVTAAPTAGSAVAVNFLANMDSITDKAYDQYVPFTGFLSKYPSGGWTGVSCSTSAPDTDTELYVAAGGTTASVTEGGCSGSLNSTYRVFLDGDSADEDYTGNTSSATRVAGAAQFSFTPAVAGEYILSVWNDVNEDGAINIGEAVQTITITVGAAAPTGYSNSLSKAYLKDGNGTTAGTAGSDAMGSVASSTVANAVAASVDITLVNLSGGVTGGALTNVLNATVTGAGFVKWAATGTDTPSADSCNSASSRSADLTATSSNNTLYICADGTSGKSTVTIYVTEVTGVVNKLATKTVTFHGSVAKLEVAASNLKVAKAGGGTLGDNDATRAEGTTAALVIKATDADGNPVSGLTLQQISSALAVANTDLSGACNEDNPYTLTASDTAANIYSSGGEGFYNCQIVTPTTAKSGDSATLTYRVADPASLTGGFLTTTYPITIGGALASATIALDKATYAPGEQMTITFTGKDAAGNTPWDGQNVIGSLTSNKSLGVALPTSRSLINGTRTNSSLAPLFAPAASGPFTLTMFENTDAYVKRTVTATVSDDAATSAANAASDAAAEAIDAANAATDAANLAAEAADAATVAAEEARDAADAATAAVEKLASDFNALVNSVKAQIATLANTISKIAKKVKA